MSNMTLEQAQQFVLDLGTSPADARRVMQALGFDPDRALFRCEGPGCSEVVEFTRAHSFISAYATTGEPGVPAFQCESLQHFGCSPVCAVAALQQCIEEHLKPAHAALVAQARAVAPTEEQPAAPVVDAG